MSPSRLCAARLDHAFAAMLAVLGVACGEGGGASPQPAPAPDVTATGSDASVAEPAALRDAGDPRDADDAGTRAGDARASQSDASDAAAPADAASGPRFDEALFMATHNSYSGQARGSMVDQLEAGVRFLELDLHDDDFANFGDYRLGHDGPGNQLAVGAPNPTTDRLRDWLYVIVRWSAAHPQHAPITVGLDLKKNLTDNPGFASGNPAALNEALEGALGARLLAARDVPIPWPALDALRGRVLAVLSGDEATRRAYRLDAARAPSVAMNDAGQVVEVHASARGDLWYWTGTLEPAGAVRWRRHGRFGKGAAPAVALSDAGLVVEIHEAAGGALAYRAGRLDGALEVAWQAEQTLGRGARPSVRTINGGPAVKAVWSGGAAQNIRRSGAFDAAATSIAWEGSAGQATTDARFDEALAERGVRWVRVRTGRDGLAPDDTLLYATAAVTVDRVRYDQVAFVEHQKGGDALLGEEARFYAATAAETGWLAQSRREGKVVRAWQFNDVSAGTTPPASFPATDVPAAGWYVAYAQQHGAVR